MRKEIVTALIAALASVVVAYITARPVAQDAARQEVIGLKGVPVGTVVGSMLRPDQFAMALGDSWVPADGRNALPSWDYTKVTGNTTIPDLRGVFLRGLNVFDPANGRRTDGLDDPVPGADHRKAGLAEIDTLASHTHKLLKAATDVTSGQMTPNSRRFASNLVDVYAGVPPLESEATGAAETHPKNAAIYWYIRVK